ncbi:MAG: hypothetical protein VX874_11595 [Pseudomonadota bacterium]|nr:hypothetical protein [Pseudomonadota bacterium]
MPSNAQDLRQILATDSTLKAFWKSYLPQLQRQISDKYGFSITADELLSLSAVRINVLAQDANAMDVLQHADSSPRLKKHLAERELLGALANPNAPLNNEINQKIYGMSPEQKMQFAREHGLHKEQVATTDLTASERAQLEHELSVTTDAGRKIALARKLGLS